MVALRKKILIGIGALVIVVIIFGGGVWLGVGLGLNIQRTGNVLDTGGAPRNVSQYLLDSEGPTTKAIPVKTQYKTSKVDEQIAACEGIPNHSTQTVVNTTRLFINLPKAIYPDRENNLQFKTIAGNATAGYISNGGSPGESSQATPECFSYYVAFTGTGEVDLFVQSSLGTSSDYFVRFIVVPAT